MHVLPPTPKQYVCSASAFAGVFHMRSLIRQRSPKLDVVGVLDALMVARIHLYDVRMDDLYVRNHRLILPNF